MEKTIVSHALNLLKSPKYMKKYFELCRKQQSNKILVNLNVCLSHGDSKGQTKLFIFYVYVQILVKI